MYIMCGVVVTCTHNLKSEVFSSFGPLLSSTKIPLLLLLGHILLPLPALVEGTILCLFDLVFVCLFVCVSVNAKFAFKIVYLKI